MIPTWHILGRVLFSKYLKTTSDKPDFTYSRNPVVSRIRELMMSSFDGISSFSCDGKDSLQAAMAAGADMADAAMRGPAGTFVTK